MGWVDELMGGVWGLGDALSCQACEWAACTFERHARF